MNFIKAWQFMETTGRPVKASQKVYRLANTRLEVYDDLLGTWGVAELSRVVIESYYSPHHEECTFADIIPCIVAQKRVRRHRWVKDAWLVTSGGSPSVYLQIGDRTHTYTLATTDLLADDWVVEGAG